MLFFKPQLNPKKKLSRSKLDTFTNTKGLLNVGTSRRGRSLENRVDGGPVSECVHLGSLKASTSLYACPQWQHALNLPKEENATIWSPALLDFLNFTDRGWEGWDL